MNRLSEEDSQHKTRQAPMRRVPPGLKHLESARAGPLRRASLVARFPTQMMSVYTAITRRLPAE
jgi:hypothetical protein